MRPLLLAIATSSAALFGCASPAVTSQVTTAPVEAAPAPTSSAVASAASPAGPPKFEVHEWGLVDIVGHEARLLAGPHGTTPRAPARPLRKPVLYFHLLDGTPSVDAVVKVSVPSPGVAEYFPPSGLLTNGRKELTWAGLHVRKGACHYHLARQTTCSTADGCETAELPNYETDDSACIEAGNEGFNLLFYRGSIGAEVALPFEILDGGKSLKISRRGAADVVGPIIYARETGGETLLGVHEPPEVGQSIEVAPPTERDTVVAARALDQAMREVGLSSGEAAAFNRAWSAELFGLAQGQKVVRRDLQDRDVLLFVLPASMLDAVATLTIEPPPAAVKRFILVRYTL